MIAKAVETGTFLEINSNPDRRDLNDVYAPRRAEAVTLLVDSDSHGVETLPNIRYGIATARRAWVTAARSATRGPGTSSASCATRRLARHRLDLAQAGQPQQLRLAERRGAVEPELDPSRPSIA